MVYFMPFVDVRHALGPLPGVTESGRNPVHYLLVLVGRLRR